MSGPRVHKGTLRTAVPTQERGRPCHGAGTFPARRYQRMPATETVAKLVDADTLPHGLVFTKLVGKMSIDELSEAFFILQGVKAIAIHEVIALRLEQEKAQ